MITVWDIPLLMACKLLIFRFNIYFYSLYWAEMVLNIILILSTITLVVKVDFVPLTPEEIERVEIEELKHRMQIKDH